ncbi:tRNA (carboxymethyluridine(34)-5-O)-methyltransferase alkbh8 [Chironomus tepperi]|uniref:tRNA (carboxymethyluridine(34)-5-O)-methyltransferase alkbh8 n=1 Tax=Chironomus tepperi TaxID=113505 RepID=UPI00391F89D4
MSKIQKKIKSKQLMIQAENNEIKFSNEPQNILAILNYGLLNGIKTDIIIEKINELSSLSDFILPPNKSYCFLKFPSCDEASKILKELNGNKLWNDGFAFLMSFCENIPTYNDFLDEKPSGLIIIHDFVTDEIEQKLLALLQWDECKMKNRQVQHFGYEFIYGQNTVDFRNPLERKVPEECDELWTKLDEECPKFKGFRPDQLTVNKYSPGNGIPSHCDTHSVFEDPIISLSLGSSIVMEFKDPLNGKHCSILLPRKSLLIMSEESRYGWTHGIIPKVSDIVRTKHNFLTVQQRELRYSFTFRKLKIPPSCDCKFPSFCDIQTKIANEQNNNDQEVDEKLAAKLELENVHNVYNEIGNHFSETRHSAWPNVENFILSLTEGSILLDVGCGNGKYLNINDKITKFGCDRSETLLQVCNERKFQVFNCDCLQIPIINDSIDACISIAVIHHLATHERRVQAIKEILRVLNKNGKALIYVWAKDQQKDNKKTRYLLQHQSKNNEKVQLPEMAVLNIDEVKVELPVHKNRTQFKSSNMLVPWKLKQKEVPEEQQKVFLRYYHVFEDGELENLCKECGNVEIVKSYYDQGNHCVILKKL